MSNYWDDDDEYLEYLDSEEIADDYDSPIAAAKIVFDRIVYRDHLVGEQAHQPDEMICLVSSCMLIADIDCRDNLESALTKLANFSQKNNATFYLYQTRKGLRVIQTNRLYSSCDDLALNTLVALDSDPHYIDLCQQTNQFAARLTPKLKPSVAQQYYHRLRERDEGFLSARLPKIKVCSFLGQMNTGIDYMCLPCFYLVVDTHNYLTQATRYPQDAPMLFFDDLNRDTLQRFQDKYYQNQSSFKEAALIKKLY